MKLSTYDNPSQWLSSSQTSRICSAHYRDQLSPGKLSDKWLFNFHIFLNSNCRVFEVLSIAKVSPVSFTGDIVALEYTFKETLLSFWQTLGTKVLLLLGIRVVVVKTSLYNVGRFGHVHHRSGLTATTGFVDRFWIWSAHVFCFTRMEKNYFITKHINMWIFCALWIIA